MVSVVVFSVMVSSSMMSSVVVSSSVMSSVVVSVVVSSSVMSSVSVGVSMSINFSDIFVFGGGFINWSVFSGGGFGGLSVNSFVSDLLNIVGGGSLSVGGGWSNLNSCSGGVNWEWLNWSWNWENYRLNDWKWKWSWDINNNWCLRRLKKDWLLNWRLNEDWLFNWNWWWLEKDWSWSWDINWEWLWDWLCWWEVDDWLWDWLWWSNIDWLRNWLRCWCCTSLLATWENNVSASSSNESDDSGTSCISESIAVCTVCSRSWAISHTFLSKLVSAIEICNRVRSTSVK
jgi:hypothetical protein